MSILLKALSSSRGIPEFDGSAPGCGGGEFTVRGPFEAIGGGAVAPGGEGGIERGCSPLENSAVDVCSVNAFTVGREGQGISR